jgi:chitinase
VGDVRLREGQTGTRQAVFMVRLSALPQNPVTVSYAVGGGTAVAGEDYTVTSASGILTFAPGQRAKAVAVGIVGDRVREPNETLQLTLSSNVNATIRRGVATMTIFNDDAR